MISLMLNQYSEREVVMASPGDNSSVATDVFYCTNTNPYLILPVSNRQSEFCNVYWQGIIEQGSIQRQLKIIRRVCPLELPYCDGFVSDDPYNYLRNTLGRCKLCVPTNAFLTMWSISLDETPKSSISFKNRNLSGYGADIACLISRNYFENVTDLSFSNSEIGNEWMTVFSNALKHNGGALSSLTHLQLDDNQIGDAGMKAFSDAL
jgi:hypothetical protein